MEAEDRAEILWNEDAEAELVGEPLAEELVADEEPGPPVLMEPDGRVSDEPTADAAIGDGVRRFRTTTEPNPDETLFA